MNRHQERGKNEHRPEARCESHCLRRLYLVILLNEVLQSIGNHTMTSARHMVV